MRIVIDLTAILPEATGVDNILRRLVLALGKVDRQNDYRLCVNYEARAGKFATHCIGGHMPCRRRVCWLPGRPR
jgi:hypothetical protein